ncbi:MAG TPA: hypothetical protein VNY75_10555 [Rhizomicrobium sp.]|nr:hypothetical protein [Rhizomicrobium sp.]
MRAETLALHAGFDADPATRAAAVPIYQAVVAAAMPGQLKVAR